MILGGRFLKKGGSRMEKYKAVDFLMNPQALLGDLIDLIKNSNKEFFVWRNQHEIFIDSPKCFWNSWNLIFKIYFKIKLDFDEQKNFADLHGRTNIGKFWLH